MPTDEEIVSSIKEKASSLDESGIVYGLKLMGLRTHPKTIERVKLIVAMHQLNMPIVAGLVAAVRDRKDVGATIQGMHMLGDRHVLILKREIGPKSNPWLCQWVVNPVFLKHARLEDGDS